MADRIDFLGGPLDGFRADLLTGHDVHALVVVTREGNDVRATLHQRRGSDMDRVDIGWALVNLGAQTGADS